MQHLFHSEQVRRASCGIPLRLVIAGAAAAWTIYTGCASSLPLPASEVTPTLTQHHVAIYALSRGKGVPKAAPDISSRTSAPSLKPGSSRERSRSGDKHGSGWRRDPSLRRATR